MKAFLKKIISQFRNNKQENLKLIERQKHNIQLRKEKKSDVDRWINNGELFSDWDDRTLIMGAFIIPNSNIIEFGAGNMVLKGFLENYKSYTPSDIVKRFDETIVCDLNQKILFDLKSYDAAILSGVLEYVYDVEYVIRQLSTTVNQVVLSYCCADIVQLSRDKNGWLSDYNKNELESIFEKYQYEIVNYQEWRSQSIYNLIKK